MLVDNIKIYSYFYYWIIFFNYICLNNYTLQYFYFFFLADLGFRVYLFIWSYHDLLIDISEVYAIFIFVFLLLNSIIAPSILIQYTNFGSNIKQKKLNTNNYLKSSSLFITYTWSTRFISSLSKIK